MLKYDTCLFMNKCKAKDNGECSDSCQKLFRVNYLLSLSELSEAQCKPATFMIDADGADLDNFKKLKSIENDIENFVNSGLNLFLYSSTTGNGKTLWAVRLLKSYLYKIWYKASMQCHGMYVCVPRYLNALKMSITNTDEYAERVTQNILNADIVVFDDIASKSSSEYDADKLFSIINTRIDMGKSNIFTSNVYGSNLQNFLGERLFSRIENNSTCIEFTGQDKRGMKL